ncbi:MAG: EthD family reductase [Anaerolineales bacterium]
MYKLILVFRALEGVNMDAIEHRWSHEFVPQVEQMPGLRRVSISRVHRTITPEANIHLIHELYFDDLESLDEAMSSEIGQQAGQLLMAIAGGVVRVYFAEHLEDAPNPPVGDQAVEKD